MRTPFGSPRFIAPAVALGAASLVIALAACGGQTSSTLPVAGNSATGTVGDSFVAPDKKSKIKVSPAEIVFRDLGKKFAKDATISEPGYKGHFKVENTCARVATVVLSQRHGPSFKALVTPVKDGSCKVTFFDASGSSAKLAIDVAVKTTPTPSPSTSPSSSPSGSPSASPSASPSTHPSPSASPSAAPSPSASPSSAPSPSASPAAITYVCNGGGAGDLTECGTESAPGQLDLWSASGTGSVASFTSAQAGFTPADTFMESDDCSATGANVANITTTDGLTFTATATGGAAGSCTVTLTGQSGSTLNIPVTYSTGSFGVNARHHKKPPH